MYGKLFTSMYEGTLYGQWQAIITLQQLVILAASDGVVDMTPPAIAARTSVPLDIIETGLEQLAAADPAAKLWFHRDGHVSVSETAIVVNGFRNWFFQGRPNSNEWKRLRSLVFERDDYTCQYCGQRGGKLECDHITPVSRGGFSELWNLATACKPCNRSKRAKTPEEWLQQ